MRVRRQRCRWRQRPAMLVAAVLVAVLGAGLVPGWPGPAAADFHDGIEVYVDGQYVFFGDTTGRPYLQNDRLMVPIRIIAEILGAQVEFIPQPRSVRIRRGETHILLLIGKSHAVVDGRTVVLDAAPEIHPAWGRTYVPLRFVSESLSMHVAWDSQARRVVITSPPPPELRPPVAERQVHLSLGTLPARGAETVATAVLREPDGTPVTAGIRSVELEVVGDDGIAVRRRLRESDRPGYWVSHLGLYGAEGSAWILRAHFDDGSAVRTAEQELTIGPPYLEPNAALLELWARAGARPVFLTPLLDKDLDHWLPVHMTAGAEPAEVEQGGELALSAHIADAWLRPVAGVEVWATLTDPRGRIHTVDLAPRNPGEYQAATGIGFPGYGATVRWQIRAAWSGKLLAVAEGQVLTR